MTEQQGMFTIPTRLYLTPAQRARLEQLVREQEVDLADLVSQIVGAYLDALPDAPPPPPTPIPDQAMELRQRRSELQRLRARYEAAGPDAPAWLGAYLAELEDEVRRLELEVRGRD
jgi:outer membrane protein TolC